MHLAHSPCPNDTFIYHAWTQGLLEAAPPVRLTFADIDITNTACQRGEFDVAKVSFAALPYLAQDWQLLPTGGALGRGCGPLVVTKSLRRREDLNGARIAVPSQRSTAYLLFRLWAEGISPQHVEVVSFDQIMPQVLNGTYDAGLVIHEARFTYESLGLSCLEDLGQWWESTTGAPIPLGAIVAKRELDPEPITEAIRSSLKHAWAHPEASRAYVAEHAQELSAQVCQAHIDLYVNEFSYDLGEQGRAAVETLLGRAEKIGLVPGGKSWFD
ncbi:1,4-dihydroxy-6-naphthoate synthase [Natronoglycomyces albus]|uniref:1,4-dihydroxy-6-naphtoate synthase n=1 Tax=Natronoglycomyces albus TaxID=2811108 RepID=A0A895XNG0_9ACTN|nr:1,4-dihydroxy-6-naphthoate synthase [Natronoglycomyces albus]